jgi:6-phosphogluconolactonase (cycloisomerase 2 family)
MRPDPFSSPKNCRPKTEDDWTTRVLLHIVTCVAIAASSSASAADQPNVLEIVQTVENGKGDTKSFRAPRAVAISPDGRHVYVGSHLDSAIHTFVLEDTPKPLRRVQSLQGAELSPSGASATRPSQLSLFFVEWLCFDPSGDFLYSGDSSLSVIIALRRDRETGLLSPVLRRETLNDLVLSPQCAAFPTDGKHLYVAGSNGAIAVYSRSSISGGLTLQQSVQNASFTPPEDHRFDPRLARRVRNTEADGLSFPRAMRISNDSRWLYVASYIDRCVSIFERDKNTGEIEKRWQFGDERNIRAAHPSTFSASPGDECLVLGTSANGVSVFERDARTGRLKYRDRLCDPGVEKDGPAQMECVAWLAKSRCIFSASSEEKRLYLYRGNAGLTSFELLGSRDMDVGERIHGAGDSVPANLAAAPDGRHVIVVYPSHDELHVVRVKHE